MPDNSSDYGVGAILGVFLTALFAWLVQRSKGQSDKEIASARSEADVQVAVLSQWEKLTSGLSDRLATVEKDFAKYRSDMSRELEALRKAHRAEIDELRKSHRAEVDEMRRAHRAEMKAMRDQNEGLQRMIAQDSQSTAQLLGDSPVTGALNRAYPKGDE